MSSSGMILRHHSSSAQMITKQYISETRKHRGKVNLLLRVYRYLTNAVSNGTIPDAYGLLFPIFGGSQPPPKTSNAIISGTERVKLYWLQIWPVHSQGVHPNKSLIKILEKRERGRIQGLPKVLKYPLLSQGRLKLRTSIFYAHSDRIDRNKSPLKISGKVAVGVLRDSPKFSGHLYIGRIALLSLR